MATLAQVMAAVAGGAILAMAAMAGLHLWAAQRKSERDRRIQDARRLVVDGIETFRRQALADQDEPDAGSDGELPGDAVDVGGRAHLRMLVDGGAGTAARRVPGPHRPAPGPHISRPGPPSRTGRSGPVRGR